VRCHQNDGSGSEARADFPAIPNFTDPNWHAKRTDFQLLSSLLEGKNSAMPGFRGRIDERQSREIVGFVRSMNPKRAEAAAAPASEFEARFRALEQEFSDLNKEMRKLTPGK
jgi:mono/diheme cytochrome c family protein